MKFDGNPRNYKNYGILLGFLFRDEVGLLKRGRLRHFLRIQTLLRKYYDYGIEYILFLELNNFCILREQRNYYILRDNLFSLPQKFS